MMGFLECSLTTLQLGMQSWKSRLHIAIVIFFLLMIYTYLWIYLLAMTSEPWKPFKKLLFQKHEDKKLGQS